MARAPLPCQFKYVYKTMTMTCVWHVFREKYWQNTICSARSMFYPKKTVFKPLLYSFSMVSVLHETYTWFTNLLIRLNLGARKSMKPNTFDDIHVLCSTSWIIVWVSIAMGVPPHGWFISRKMPSRNGWWLGVPRFSETSISLSWKKWWRRDESESRKRLAWNRTKTCLTGAVLDPISRKECPRILQHRYGRSVTCRSKMACFVFL